MNKNLRFSHKILLAAALIVIAAFAGSDGECVARHTLHAPAIDMRHEHRAVEEISISGTAT